MSKDLPTIDEVLNIKSGKPIDREMARQQLQRIMAAERLDELKRHSYGKGQVSAYSINRRIAELETKVRGDV